LKLKAEISESLAKYEKKEDFWGKMGIKIGKGSLFDFNVFEQKRRKMEPLHENSISKERYKERTAAERGFARLKEEYGYPYHGFSGTFARGSYMINILFFSQLIKNECLNRFLRILDNRGKINRFFEEDWRTSCGA